MNNWKINKTVDLARGIDGVEVWPHALLVTGDKNAHEWSVTVMDNGKPARLSGMIEAYFVRSDGATVTASGSVSGNVATVTLPEACYAYEGDLQAVMQLIQDDVSVTLSALLLRVRQITTDVIIDPGTEIPSLDDLLAQIENMKQATKDANAATTNANQAATNAETRVDEAISDAEDRVETAVQSAETATSKANASATKADTATANANTATDRANAAAAEAEKIVVEKNIATKDYVTEQIDAIEIGGTNYYVDSGSITRLGPSYPLWDLRSNDDILPTIAPVENPPANGITRMAHYVNTRHGLNGVLVYRSNDFKVQGKAGDVFTLSCWARGNGKLRFDFYRAKGQDKIVNSDSWQRFSDTITIYEPNFSVYCYFGETDDGGIDVCGLKLERGNRATDWSPAPEDTDSSISRRSTVTYDYGGRNLKEIFGTAEALHAALAAEDYSQISVGDYWPITLNGNFWDYGSYTIPGGTTVYKDATFQSAWGPTGSDHEGSFADDNSVVGRDDNALTIYAKIDDCIPYFKRTCNNVTVKLEVAGINHYWRYGDGGDLTGNKPHIVFISRDCLPFFMRMRKGDTKWEDETAKNPWLGSAMYKTLNDAEHGVLPLVTDTDIGAYIHAGPNNLGMRALLETKALGVASVTRWEWSNRGKLFLPSVAEVLGHPFWAEMNWEGGLGNQFAIFRDSRRHISKGGGDNSGRAGWWLGSSCAGNTTFFAGVGRNGDADNGAAAGERAVPVCFIFA